MNDFATASKGAKPRVTQSVRDINMALVLEEQGKGSEAATRVRDALRIITAAYNEKHPHVGMAQRHLAALE